MNNKKNNIIKTLKDAYHRDLRKQVVKSIIAEEKGNQIPNYTIINQVFSYVLSELGWNIYKSSTEWDSLPLDIMEETFPGLKKTEWFQEQLLTAQKQINLEIKEN